MAKLYLLDGFFDPLSNGENVLPGKHGYSHVIALSSAAKAYEVLGDEKYLHAIRNAWDMIEQTQQYASGAWAAEEMFVKPRSGELAATLTSTRNHFETPCCFYAHAKLARYLTRSPAMRNMETGWSASSSTRFWARSIPMTMAATSITPTTRRRRAKAITSRSGHAAPERCCNRWPIFR